MAEFAYPNLDGLDKAYARMVTLSCGRSSTRASWRRPTVMWTG